uniref:Nodulin-like domain-containing protein n=1 Tax=Opuntia streptacantha TaxID=393608 RepID=A0A7C9AYU0_OPUST
MVGNLKAGTRPPWVGLGAAIWVQIASGNGYNFPLYSHSLKSVLGFNQRQLTMLGVANDIGENVGLLPGIVCNNFPPWVVLTIGSLCCFLGYGVLWLSLSRTVQSLPYWLDKDTSKDDVVDVHTSNHDYLLPSFCFWDQRHTVCCNCNVGSLLRHPILHHDPNCLRAIWVEAFWSLLQFHVYW